MPKLRVRSDALRIIRVYGPKLRTWTDPQGGVWEVLHGGLYLEGPQRPLGLVEWRELPTERLYEVAEDLREKWKKWVTESRESQRLCEYNGGTDG